MKIYLRTYIQQNNVFINVIYVFCCFVYKSSNENQIDKSWLVYKDML